MDNITEKVIMDAINKLRVDTTIIIIAHRLTTIKNCEVIFLLDKGELKNRGTFNELIEASDLFRKNAYQNQDINGINKNYEKTKIIAEVGINHNGSLDIGYKLIDSAAKAE